MTFKQKVYQHYLELLQTAVQMLQLKLSDVKESTAGETKRTAGDKHETALAMLQIEQANLLQQLHTHEEQLQLLQKINPDLTPVEIVRGSLVTTNHGFLFVSIAGGKALIAGEVVIALSIQSPLGKLLLGRRAGELFSFNDRKYFIEKIQ